MSPASHDHPTPRRTPDAAAPARALLLLALATAAGCQGTIGDPGAQPTPGDPGNPPPGTPPPPPPRGTDGRYVCDTATHPGSVEMHRLTLAQYQRSIGVIFDGHVQPSSNYPPGTGVATTGYSTEAPLLYPSDDVVQHVMTAAEDVAERVAPQLPTLLPCSTAAMPDETCAGMFVDRYARRAFRRAPTADERDVLLTAFRGAVMTGATFTEAVAVMADQLLQMPQFLYLGDDAAPTTRALSGAEVASRLAFMLWDSVPDDALLAAADSGALDTPAGVLAQARRLLDSPNADTTLARFIREWTGTGQVSPADKDPTLFPYFNTAYARSMNESFDRFAAASFRDNGTLHDFLRAPAAIVDPTMASFFGVTAPAAGTWARVALDPNLYSGVMTQPAMLASLAHTSEPSYVYRGRFVRKRLLCEALGSPPANAQAMFQQIMLPPDPTAREVADRVESNPTCGGCHGLIDPAGLAFEHFDALGHYRAQYASGRAIDAAGSLRNVGASNSTLMFAGPTDMLEQLAREPAVAQCFARQVFRFTMSQPETDADACAIQAMHDALDASGGRLAEALLAMTTSDSFRYRRDVP